MGLLASRYYGFHAPLMAVLRFIFPRLRVRGICVSHGFVIRLQSSDSAKPFRHFFFCTALESRPIGIHGMETSAALLKHNCAQFSLRQRNVTQLSLTMGLTNSFYSTGNTSARPGKAFVWRAREKGYVQRGRGRERKTDRRCCL